MSQMDHHDHHTGTVLDTTSTVHAQHHGGNDTGGMMSHMNNSGRTAHSGHAMDMSSGGMHSMSMSMSFHTGYQETILFSSWRPTSVLAFVGSAVIVFLAAILYEGIKLFRERYVLSRRSKIAAAAQKEALKVAPECCSPQNGSVEAQPGRFKDFADRLKECRLVELASPFAWHHFTDTILYGLQLIMSYLLMLIFMTYNVWLCIAVIVGCMVGYFAFGWKRRSVNSLVDESCH